MAGQHADIDHTGLTGVGGGTLSDHTHAVTGSGATGGGATLNPTGLQLPTATGAIATTEGYVGYDSDDELVKVYDGQRERWVSAVGWMTRGLPLNFGPNLAFATVETLAANGGSVAVPIVLAGHLLLEFAGCRSTDTGTARIWGWDLYVQRLNNGNAGENTLNRIAASSADDSFTPGGAASNRTITASGGPIYLGPGFYWLVIQNRHATNSFGVGYTANTGSFGPTTNQVKTTTNPNGATLDFVAATWAKNSHVYGVGLFGRVFGQTTSF